MAIFGTWLGASAAATAVLSVLTRGACREDRVMGYLARGE
jgi:hypothetical protein